MVMLPLTLPFMQDDRFIAQYITLQIDHRIAAKEVWGLTEDVCLFSPEHWLHDKPLCLASCFAPPCYFRGMFSLANINWSPLVT